MPRVGLAAFLCAALLSPSSPALEQDPESHEIADDIGRYLVLLGELRAGAEAPLTELRALARHLCLAHGRCDTEDVVDFYARLTPTERGQGLADEAEFDELHAVVSDAGTLGTPEGESWSDVRREVEEDLAAFIARVAPRGDFTPAAHAHSLLSVIAEQRAKAARSAAERDAMISSAESHAHDAIALFERAGMVTPRLEPLWVLGSLERARGNPAAAHVGFEGCLALARTVGNDDFRARALFGLVALARDAGDVDRIERLLARVASFSNPSENWPLAREHANRLLHDDRAEEALAFLLAHEPIENGYLPQWHACLGAAFLRTGDLASARRELQWIGEARDEVSVLLRATLDLAEGHPQWVADALGRAGALEPLSPRGAAHACALVGEAWLASNRPEVARPWLEEALLRAAAWRASGNDAAGGSVIGEWLGLHTVVLLARAHARLGEPLEAARVVEEYQSRALRGPGSRVTESELLAWARDHEVELVTWTIGPDASLVAHVSQSGDAWAEPLERGRRAFDDAVRRLREAAVEGDGPRARQLAAELRAALIPAGLHRRLTEVAHGSRVLFLLHGPLEALPLALLELDGEPVDERFTTLVLPGLPDLDEDGRAPLAAGALDDWTLLGSPVAKLGRSSAERRLLLPGASRELAALAQLHPRARLASGAAFVRGSLTEALQSGHPLHVATHLVYTDRCGGTLLSPVGLELSDGDVMCAEEILALRPRLPLVVLTACETAGGRFVDAEGLHGVSRAFLESGTRNLVVTLWPVEDDAASSFAAAFHEGLLRGLAPSVAARDARRRLRAEGRSTADWAAFRFTGRD